MNVRWVKSTESEASRFVRSRRVRKSEMMKVRLRPPRGADECPKAVTRIVELDSHSIIAPLHHEIHAMRCDAESWGSELPPGW